jgi:exopolysaccharide biosynthesis protein
MKIGDAVSIDLSESAVLQWDGKWPHQVLHQPSAVVGSGGTLVSQGFNRTTCVGRDENPRPRSAIGWLPNGDELVVTVSGRATVDGTRWGGSTVHQFAEIMRSLGARQATALDGGTSTTLLIRRTVGGPLVRLDRAMSEYQRPVVDALVFRA